MNELSNDTLLRMFVMCCILITTSIVIIWIFDALIKPAAKRIYSYLSGRFKFEGKDPLSRYEQQTECWISIVLQARRVRALQKACKPQSSKRREEEAKLDNLIAMEAQMFASNEDIFGKGDSKDKK